MLQLKISLGKCLLIVLCCWLSLTQVQGKTDSISDKAIVNAIGREANDLMLQGLPSLHFQIGKDSTKSKSKVIAAILSFPYPFGMLGLHRIYLGANPIIPILYFVTFGGLLGIVPFIDMMVLILSKDTKPFYKNSKILMWYQENT